jgi:hypothetical protein
MDHAIVATALLAIPFATALFPPTVRLLPVIAEIGQLIVTFHNTEPTPASSHHFEVRLQESLRELGRIIVEWAYNHIESDDPSSCHANFLGSCQASGGRRSGGHRRRGQLDAAPCGLRSQRDPPTASTT